jgi:hypothetical protein
MSVSNVQGKRRAILTGGIVHAGRFLTLASGLATELAVANLASTTECLGIAVDTQLTTGSPVGYIFNDDDLTFDITTTGQFPTTAPAIAALAGFRISVQQNSADPTTDASKTTGDFAVVNKVYQLYGTTDHDVINCSLVKRANDYESA